MDRQNENIDLKKIVRQAYDARKGFLIAFVLACVLGLCYYFFYPRTYRAQAFVEFREKSDMPAALPGGKSGIGSLVKDFGLGSLGGGSLEPEDEIQKIVSNHNMRTTAMALGLYADYNAHFLTDGLYDRSPIFVRMDSLPLSDLEGKIELRIELYRDGTLRVKKKSRAEKLSLDFASLPATFQTKEGPITLIANPLGEKISKLSVTITPLGWVAESLAKGIKGELFNKNSSLVEMNTKGTNRKLLTDFMRAIVQNYNVRTNQVVRKESGVSIDFLNRRISDTMDSLRCIEENMQRFKQKNKVSDPVVDIKFYAESMRELQATRIQVESQLNIINMIDRYVNDPKNRYRMIPPIGMSKVPSSTGDPIGTFNEILMKRQDLIASSKRKKNPKIDVYTQQLDSVHVAVRNMVAGEKEATTQTLDGVKRQIDDILRKVGDVPSVERGFVDLKRQQEIYQAVYLILLQKREQLSLKAGEDSEQAIMLDEPSILKKKAHPRMLFAGLIVIFITLLGGGASMLRRGRE